MYYCILYTIAHWGLGVVVGWCRARTIWEASGRRRSESSRKGAATQPTRGGGRGQVGHTLHTIAHYILLLTIRSLTM